MTPTPEEEDQAWRRDNDPAKHPKKPKRGDVKRFIARNTVVYGGWLLVLTPSELRVWLVLDTASQKDGTARIGGTAIGRLTGMKRNHAAAAAKSLEKRGLVRVLVRGNSGRGGKRTANVYELLAPPPRKADHPQSEEPD
ncbi:MAG: hypothetical protein RIR77_973 [Planctomycetota bacterium]